MIFILKIFDSEATRYISMYLNFWTNIFSGAIPLIVIVAN